MRRRPYAASECFFSGDDVRRYRENVKTDPAARQRYETLTQKAEEDLSKPYATWEDANASDTQGANFGILHWQANDLCVSLGLKF